jgi:hypothetical protein
MAVNNLRVVYNNVADTSVITATSTAVNFSTNNMQKDTKGVVWRSTSSVDNTITLNWSTYESIGCISLPFTNLSSSATITYSLYNGANATGTLLYTSGAVPAIPYNLATWGTIVTGVMSYSFGGGNPVRHYPTSTIDNVRSMTINISDGGNPQGYFEISRIVCGKYWSPKYNTEFGLSISINDQSSHSRGQAGNLITDVGTVYKTLDFNLGYLDASDRNMFIQILKLNGMRKSMFISVFPNDTDVEKEYSYQIYGRLSSNASIVHPMFHQYASSVTIEEV